MKRVKGRGIMDRFYSLLIVIALSILLSGCGDPAAGKVKAITKEAVAVVPTSSASEGEKINVKAEDSKLEFVGSHIGSALTGGEQGAFEKFSGIIALVPPKLENSRVSIEIDMNSVT